MPKSYATLLKCVRYGPGLHSSRTETKVKVNLVETKYESSAERMAMAYRKRPSTYNEGGDNQNAKNGRSPKIVISANNLPINHPVKIDNG
jgi:hypothetical protein